VKDHRYVDELTVPELEKVLRLRRREERLRRMGNRPEAVDPLDSGDGASGEQRPNRDTARPLGKPRALGETNARGRYSAVMEAPRMRRRRRPIKWRWVRDQILLLVEVLAILGLIWVVARMVLTVEEINEESRAMQALPTLTPTPMIQALVLPGGHTPPDALGRSQPAPIPVHLRDQVVEITPLPVPTPGPEHAQRIVIPKIGVDAPVLEGGDWESLKKGAVHLVGTANPGERGNSVILAHNDIYGEIFRDLPDLTVGDEVIVHTHTTAYRYEVGQTRIVEPTEVSILDATSTPVLTLYTCYPYGIDTHRIVVTAALVVD
jgi:sortase A